MSVGHLSSAPGSRPIRVRFSGRNQPGTFSVSRGLSRYCTPGMRESASIRSGGHPMSLTRPGDELSSQMQLVRRSLIVSIGLCRYQRFFNGVNTYFTST